MTTTTTPKRCLCEFGGAKVAEELGFEYQLDCQKCCPHDDRGAWECYNCGAELEPNLRDEDYGEER